MQMEFKQLTYTSKKMIYMFGFRIDQHIVYLHVFDLVQYWSVCLRSGMSQVYFYCFSVGHGFHEIFHSKQIWNSEHQSHEQLDLYLHSVMPPGQLFSKKKICLKKARNIIQIINNIINLGKKINRNIIENQIIEISIRKSRCKREE